MKDKGYKELEEFKAFWKDYNDNISSKNCQIHQKDKISIEEKITARKPELYSATTADSDIKDSAIITNLRPEPFCGNIEKAKVFILSYHPGFYSDNSKKHKENKDNRIDLDPTHCSNLHSNKKLYKSKSNSADDYWLVRFNGIFKKCLEKLETSKNNLDQAKHIQDKIAKLVCTLQATCYYSKGAPKIQPGHLCSSTLTKSLVHKYLVPKKDILIFSWRKTAFWGLEQHETAKQTNGARIIIEEKQAWMPRYIRKTTQCDIAEFLTKAIKEDQQNT